MIILSSRKQIRNEQDIIDLATLNKIFFVSITEISDFHSPEKRLQ